MDGPDETLTQALGVLLTVLVFFNGFVSVRLHAFHERMLDRIRVLQRDLAASSPFSDIEAEDRDIRRQLWPGLSRSAPLFSLVIVATIVVLVAFAMIDSNTASQRVAVIAIGLASVLVVAATFWDQATITRTLRQRLDELPLAQLESLERRLFRVHRLATLARTRMHLQLIRAYVEGFTERLAPDVTARALQPLDKALALLGGRFPELGFESDPPSRVIADECEREVNAILTDVGDLLRRPGLTSWPRALGFAGLAQLYEHFDSSWGFEPTLHWATVEQHLLTAANAQPWEPRWAWALACYRESMGDLARAASLVEKASRLEWSDSSATATEVVKGTGGASGMASALEHGLAYPMPASGDVYVSALNELAAPGPNSASSARHMVAILAVQAAARSRWNVLDDDEWSRPYRTAIENTVKAELRDSNAGWISAEHLIDSCRAALRTEPGGVRHLIDGLEGIRNELVEPAKDRWQREHEASVRQAQSVLDAGTRSARNGR